MREGSSIPNQSSRRQTGEENEEIIKNSSSLEQEDQTRIIDEAVKKTIESSQIPKEILEFPQYHHDFVLKLIEAGGGFTVARDIYKFQGLDYFEIATKLIEAGFGFYLAENLNNFQELNNDIALKLIEVGRGDAVAENLNSFQGLNYLEIALKLIETRHGDAVARNLDKFQELNNDIALKLSERGYGYAVVENLDKFQGLDYHEIALKIIEAGDGAIVAQNLDKLEGLDHYEIALKIIESRHGDIAAYSFDKFQGLDNREIALKLIEAGYIHALADNLDKFQGLDNEIALKLIEGGQEDAVINNLDKFEGFDREIALKLIETGYEESVVKNLDKFQGLDHSEIALKIIETGRESSVVRNLDKFQGLDDEIALKLIEKGDGFFVAKNLDRFQGLDYRKIALLLIEEGNGSSVADNLDKFQGLDHGEIAFKLIGLGRGRSVANNFDKFQGLDHSEIALKLIENRCGDAVANNFDKFQGLDHSEIALKLIENRCGDGVANNIDKFQGLDREIALSLIELGRGENVVYNFDKFQGLDYREIALKLIRRGNGANVANYLEKFQGIDHREIALKIIEEGNADDVAWNLDKFQGSVFERARSSQKDEMLSPVEFLAIHLKESMDNDGSDGSSEKEKEEENLSPEEKYADIAHKLIESGVWNDEENIIKPFENGAEMFGNERMFRYLNREGLSRHDGLHAFNSIIQMANESGLSPDAFYNKILDQVSHDGATYDSGTAHHEINQIAVSFNNDFAGNLEKAGQYKSIPNIQELASNLSNASEVFSGWKNLKRYSNLTELLKKTEILEGLEKEPNEKLRAYVAQLAFHPEGKVDMQKVLEFWSDPKTFLDLPDSHTPENVHDRKKPSNLAEIPNLDLTPEELRDALVEGSLDRIQAFVPMKAEYVIGYSLREETSKALGSFKEKIPGLADDPKKLFSELQSALKPFNVTIQEFLSGKTISDEAEEHVQTLLSKQGIGLSEETRKKFPSYNVVMRTNAKSDPHGVLAGNDTACCMYFGSGKNNVYTWNPACTLATLEIERPDGGRRTIAQSVLTKDRDIGKNVQEVAAQLRQEGEEHLQDILSEEILRSSSSIIACDNIEVAPNYKSEEYQDIIKTAYEDFFREYIERYGKEQGFEKDRVVIGLGYTDALTNLPKISNTTVPEAPVGYSDKMHDSCYELSLKPNTKDRFSVLKKEITATQETPAKKETKNNVSALTFEDTMATAYLEGKAYAGNKSLMEYMWKIENVLIAKDINNSAKMRPDMSFKYENEGKMRGYLIAYEGKLGQNENNNNGEPVIYIADLAVAEPDTLGGGRAGASLIGEFVERYNNEYLKKGNLIPLFAYAREQTSYRLIMKELQRYEKELNISFSTEEGEKYRSGGDTMHPILIRPKVE